MDNHRYSVVFNVPAVAPLKTNVVAKDEDDARQRGTRKLFGARAYWKIGPDKAFRGWVYRRKRRDAAPWVNDVICTDYIICAVERVSP